MRKINSKTNDTGRVSLLPKLLGFAVVASMMLVGHVSPASANNFIFNGTSGGLSVSATADITVSGGQMSIVLTNDTPNTVSIAQAISGLTFDVWDSTTSTYVNLSGLTVIGQTGELITFSSKNTTGTLGGVQTLGWGLSSGTLNALGFIGNGTQPPDELILGVPDVLTATTATYLSANGSITNSASHQPLVLRTASFTLDLGTTWDPNWELQNVTMYFGTNGSPVKAPEPASLLLLCTGLVGVGAASRRLRRNRV